MADESIWVVVVPTWFGAGASGGALVAAALAARAAWAVLRVERGRDEEEREAQKRVQAERFAGWASVVRSDPADSGSPSKWGASLRNASELPVYEVRVVYEPIASGYEVEDPADLEVVPPGEWMVTGHHLYPRPSQPRFRPDAGDIPDLTYRIALRFTDAAGRWWRRDRQGALFPVARMAFHTMDESGEVHAVQSATGNRSLCGRQILSFKDRAWPTAKRPWPLGSPPCATCSRQMYGEP
jgi:hypothetical protein